MLQALKTQESSWIAQLGTDCPPSYADSQKFDQHSCQHRLSSRRQLDSYAPSKCRDGGIASHESPRNDFRAKKRPFASTSPLAGSKGWAEDEYLDGSGSLHGSIAPTARERTDLGAIDTVPEDYKRGDIIFFPHATPSLNPFAVFGRDVVEAESIGTICAKFRPGIVTHIYEDYLIVAPIYSSQGNGLERKTAAYRRGCLPIVNDGDDIPDMFAGMTQDVLTTWEEPCVRRNAYVRLAETCHVDFAVPIKHTGNLLHPDSTDLLLSRLKKLFEQGLTPPRAPPKYTDWTADQDQKLQKLQDSVQLLLKTYELTTSTFDRESRPVREIPRSVPPTQV